MSSLLLQHPYGRQQPPHGIQQPPYGPKRTLPDTTNYEDEYKYNDEGKTDREDMDTDVEKNYSKNLPWIKKKSTTDDSHNETVWPLAFKRQKLNKSVSGLNSPMMNNETIDDNCKDDNCPLDGTPKSDLWQITNIDTSKGEDISSTMSTHTGYLQKVERMFAETILRYTIFEYTEQLLYKLVFADSISILTDSTDKKSFSGGHRNESDNNKLKKELTLQSTDTQHDFKPGRNKVYPSDAIAIPNKQNGLTVYERLNAVIGYQPEFGNQYIQQSPIAFEEDIKVDYLLGTLAGELDDIYYYFTDVEANPSTWTKRRQQFFGQDSNRKVNNINSLVTGANERGYTGWILDACVSGRVSMALNGGRKKTLANIWDPVKGTFGLTDLIENDTSHFTLVNETPQSISSGKIYDCIIKSNNNNNNTSLYDSVYDDLLNTDLNTDLNIKLRLYVTTANSQCGVAIKITIKSKSTYFIIGSGFPVQVLAGGMRYIYDKSTNPNNNYTGVDTILKTIIDYVYDNLDNDDKTTIIEKMLYRFKSSGDHGTSDTVKKLNEIGLFYLFLSGDNLAYVYAISTNTPTIATYYKASSKSGGDDDEEDDEGVADSNDGQIQGNHFIVAHFPTGDDMPKIIKKLHGTLGALAELYTISKISIPQDSVRVDVATLLALTTQFATKNSDLNTYIRLQQSGIFDPTTIRVDFDTRLLNELDELSRIPQLRILLQQNIEDTLNDILLNKDPVQLKEFTASLDTVVNKLFFMHKYSDIIILSTEMIKADREAFADIVKLDESASSGRSQRSITTKLSTAYTSVKKSFLSAFKSVKNKSPTLSSSSIKEVLQTIQVNDRKTQYDEVITIRQRLIDNSKHMFSRLKKLGFQDNAISQMKNNILNVNNPLIKKLKSDLVTNAGSDAFAQQLGALFEKELTAKMDDTNAEFTLDAPPSSMGGLKGGKTSKKHNKNHKPKRKTKKISNRLRKTRKNTKGNKYIKKNVTKHRR